MAPFLWLVVGVLAFFIGCLISDIHDDAKRAKKLIKLNEEMDECHRRMKEQIINNNFRETEKKLDLLANHMRVSFKLQPEQLILEKWDKEASDIGATGSTGSIRKRQ